MQNKSASPLNESTRIKNLSDLDLDYTSIEDDFASLTKLASWVADAPVSLLNLIDSFTQWTISSYGVNVQQMPRELSVCQYTIVQPDYFEVADLSQDDRFKDLDYVKDNPGLRFYLGVPLITKAGAAIGALCVFDSAKKTLSPEKIDYLKIIAGEIVCRLQAIKKIKALKQELAEAGQLRKKVVHDIRGPISGILGLTKIILEKGSENTLDEVLEIVKMFQSSSESILGLADEIFTDNTQQVVKYKRPKEVFNLELFKEKLTTLYHPQALHKQIELTINTNLATAQVPISKDKLLQIAGNLIANAIKFTPPQGTVTVNLDLVIGETANKFSLEVKNSGSTLDRATINDILHNHATSTIGTSGESGYGFGLQLVTDLIKQLNGTLSISSEPHRDTTFNVTLPQAQLPE